MYKSMLKTEHNSRTHYLPVLSYDTAIMQIYPGNTQCSPILTQRRWDKNMKDGTVTIKNVMSVEISQFVQKNQ